MSTSAEQHRAPEAARAGMPDFFIVGHAKCGTTALYEMLRRHPQIFMPDFKSGAGKEPWYFSRDNPQPQTGPERSVAFTGRYAMTLEEYLQLFADASPGQRIGEGSTSYLWSRTAAARIAAVRPDARIIAIFREPASFLSSLHLQLLKARKETERDFRKAVSLDEDRREGRNIPEHTYWPAALIYSDRIRYVEQLRRYEEVFPEEQILALIYDDFRADNEATVRRVLRFLDVDDTFPVERLQVNPSITIRRPRVMSLTKHVKGGTDPLAVAARRAILATTSASARRRFLYPIRNSLVYGEPPPPDEAFMLELRHRFKGEVEALSEHLNRDLVALWGYDRIG